MNNNTIEISPVRTQYPDCYLHILNVRNGQQWIIPIGGNVVLDVEPLVVSWIAKEFDGDMVLDGFLTPGVYGDYYAKIMTGGCSPDRGKAHREGGFDLKVK